MGNDDAGMEQRPARASLHEIWENFRRQPEYCQKLVDSMPRHIQLMFEIMVFILTWILGVASKQLRLLHGRVGDSTTSVNSLSPQMSELVEDDIAS